VVVVVQQNDERTQEMGAVEGVREDSDGECEVIVLILWWLVELFRRDRKAAAAWARFTFSCAQCAYQLARMQACWQSLVYQDR